MRAALTVPYRNRSLTVRLARHESGGGSGLLGFSLDGVKDTMFVNDDDDDDNATMDCDQLPSDDDDDVVRATVSLRSPARVYGTVRIDDKAGFAGPICNCGDGDTYVGQGSEWLLNDETDWSVDLLLSAALPSESYGGSQLKMRWIPTSGVEKTCVRRFTIVSPEAEPICNEIKQVFRNGVTNNLTYNPCGVGIGRDAYFKIRVDPQDYPDARITWSAEGAGGVSFVGGNTGREVCVRGVSEGDLTLSVDIGGCGLPQPSFPLQVVDNVQVKLSVWIISDAGGELACSPMQVREMVKDANDIYEQVGMSFYIDTITITNIPAAYDVIYHGNSTEQTWDFDRVADIATGTGGLECYFIGKFLDAANVLAANSQSGMLLTRRANGVILAHEIGHACGLKDIYWDKGPESVSMTETFEWRHATYDWNGGSLGRQTVGSRYYHHNTKLYKIIDRLLMLGDRDAENDQARDISTGAVEGVYKHGDTDDESIRTDVRTGVFRADMATRHPVHQ